MLSLMSRLVTGTDIVMMNLAWNEMHQIAFITLSPPEAGVSKKSMASSLVFLVHLEITYSQAIIVVQLFVN